VNPKLSIAIHSGVFDFWPLLENLLKSFLVCNEYPNIEIMLVESGGNKKIRDWFEKIDFDDLFINFDGQKTNIKKHPEVKIEKTLKFIDLDSSVTGLSCYNRAISQCIDSFKGDFFVMMAEDNQFIVEGDLVNDYIKILDHFGRDSSMVSFFSLHKYKLYKKNNLATGPHKIDSTDMPFFTPVQQKWNFDFICNRGVYNRINAIRAQKNIKEEDGWDIIHGLVQQNNDIVSDLFPTTGSDFRRVYSCIPSGLWMDNNDRECLIKKIKDSSKNNPNHLLYKTIKKEKLLESLKGRYWKKPISSEDFSIENEPAS
jgi:hypothetical protein